MAESERRIRGWVISRSWEYDRNDPTSKYHGADEDTWRDGVLTEWRELAEQDATDWCHFIFHYKDEVKDENNKITIKPIHAHAVVRFRAGRTQSAVLKAFCGSNQRTQNCEPVDPQKGGYRTALLYLTHQTSSAYNAEKTWYHHTEVQQFGKRYLDLIKTDKRDRKNSQDVENTAREFIEKVGSGELKVRVAKAQFKELEGAYALTKYKAAFESADDDFKEELIAKMQRVSAMGQFRKRTSYVSGPGRSGKTLLAECMAVDLHGADEVYVPASGGSEKLTSDFVDLYHTEKATVFSDIEPTEFGPKAFYNMFDPHKWSPSKSRNKSKPWLSTDCYIADNRKLGDFMIRLVAKRDHYNMLLNQENADSLIMAFGRVQRVLSYGTDSLGRSVVWMGRLKDEMPNIEDVVIAGKKNNATVFTPEIVGAFYETLGCVPYDKKAPVFEERMRMAKVINAVYAGDMQADGFVPVAQPVLVSV